jgi:hypothetical protein
LSGDKPQLYPTFESIGEGMSVSDAATGLPRVRNMMRAMLLALAGMTVMGLPAAADTTHLSVRYDIRWLNLAPIGKGFLTLKLEDSGAYSADITARILTARTAVSSSGMIGGDRVLPDAFAVNIVTGERRHTIQIGMTAGTVRQTKVTPEPKPKPDLVALTPAHQRGILDPLSATLMPIPRGDGELSASVCNRTLPVFEGTERFDVVLSSIRKTTVEKTDGEAYEGPAVVCKARYRAIAGHRESADYVAYFARDPLIEVWLAPVEGAGLMIPIKTSVPTPFGTVVVEASRFKLGGTDNAKAKPDDGEP